jgi:Ca2+:H+ antiporter
VAPLLVILSPWLGPAPLHLGFGRAELGCLFLGVLIGAVTAGDGRGNWFKGVQLLAVYLVMALLFYFVPGGTR